MDHRITTAMIIFFGGTLGFTLLIVALTSSLAGDGGAAVAQGALVENTADPRADLSRTLATLERETAKYRRDHGGQGPDFAVYPKWEQLTQPTDAIGRAVPGPPPGETFGPYIGPPPVNPLNRMNTVVATDAPVRPGQRLPGNAAAGFVYNSADG